MYNEDNAKQGNWEVTPQVMLAALKEKKNINMSVFWKYVKS